MSRPRSEMQFGSDSFLDVVANIVGILIILIVIAGLRVSQAPVRVPRAIPLASAAVADVYDETPIEPLIVPEDEEPNPAPPAAVATISPPMSAPWQPSPALLDQADDLSAEILELKQAYRAAADQTAAVRQAETDLSERLTRLRDQMESRDREANSLAREAETQRTSFEQLQATAEQLLRQIAEEERKKPLTKTLEHRVTPVSKIVTGNEQHYRLIGNRISEVPVNALSIRLKEQMERRKDWLMKQRSHQGTVGPINGYTMHYMVQRENMGVLDEVRYGQGMVRISVSHWRIEPEPDLEKESAAEALRPGSRFYESLAIAEEGSSLTFWTYPDSYALYRELQKFAHEQGFLVAGRPLPIGIPISGSPNGSKSAGQ